MYDPLPGQGVQHGGRGGEQEAGAAEEGHVHELPASLDCRQYAGHMVLPGSSNIK